MTEMEVRTNFNCQFGPGSPESTPTRPVTKACFCRACAQGLGMKGECFQRGEKSGSLDPESLPGGVPIAQTASKSHKVDLNVIFDRCLF